jgi:hypothetical protein
MLHEAIIQYAALKNYYTPYSKSFKLKFISEVMTSKRNNTDNVS